MSAEVKLNDNEVRINRKIDENKDIYVEASHEISAHPQITNQEFFAQELLTKRLTEAGFTITKNIAGHETGFIAEKDSGKPGPSIAFVAEYDALPVVGHGCGHNVIGTLSSLAAVGVSEVLEDVGGKIFVYGTPGEEGGDNGSAKASFANAGLFDHIDAAMMIHPTSRKNSLTNESLAVKCYSFEFFGRTSHASGAPHKGINALDALILFFNGIALLRQQTTPDIRIHGVITHGGEAPNVIPDYTKAKFFIRSATRARSAETLERIIKIAEGAAIATGATYKATSFQNDVNDTIPNEDYDLIFQKHARKLGLEFEFAEKGGKGSSDVGNVSYVIPIIQPSIQVADEDVLGHNIAFAEACVSERADIKLVEGAKALAYTALQLLTDKETLENIKEKHKKLIAEKEAQTE